MIGIHVNKISVVTGKPCKDILKAIEIAYDNLDINALSLFMHGPRNTKKNNISYDAVQKYCADNNIVIFPHGSYVSVNIWNVTNENINTVASKNALKHLKDSLTSGREINATGVVIHVPRHNIETIVDVMSLLSRYNETITAHKAGQLAPITLEMPASSPMPLLTYETPEKLNALCATLAADNSIRLDWNICLDTCHLHAGGVYLAESESWNTYVDQLSPLTQSKIKLIHLNGAELKNFGTGKDGHMIPCSEDDAIWGSLVSERFRKFLDKITTNQAKYMDLTSQLNNKEKTIFKQSSLYTLIKFAKKNSIALICEINDFDYVNTKFIMDLVKYLARS